MSCLTIVILQQETSLTSEKSVHSGDGRSARRSLVDPNPLIFHGGNLEIPVERILSRCYFWEGSLTLW